MRLIPKYIVFISLSVCLLFITIHTQAEEATSFYMEVMDLSGEVTATKAGITRTLEEKALLGPHEVVYVGANSHVNLALDSQWQNTVHIPHDSKVFVKSVLPTGFYLKKGSLLGSLGYMPKDSALEIQTPSLIVGVSDAIFETRFDEKTMRSTTSTLEGEAGAFAFLPGRNAESKTIRIPELSQLSNSNRDPTLSPLRSIPPAELTRMRSQVFSIKESVAKGVREGRLGNVALHTVVDWNKEANGFNILSPGSAADDTANESNNSK